MPVRWHPPPAIISRRKFMCFKARRRWKREFDGKTSGDIDASIVATHMMLQAWELGIGSTWIMHFIPEAVSEEFNLPENVIPVSILVMGYPAADAVPNVRHGINKNPKDTVTFL
jgi:nitroreductase